MRAEIKDAELVTITCDFAHGFTVEDACQILSAEGATAFRLIMDKIRANDIVDSPLECERGMGYQYVMLPAGSVTKEAMEEVSRIRLKMEQHKTGEKTYLQSTDGPMMGGFITMHDKQNPELVEGYYIQIWADGVRPYPDGTIRLPPEAQRRKLNMVLKYSGREG